MRDTDLENDPMMRQWMNPTTDNQSASIFQVDLGKSVPWIAFSWFLSGGAIIGLILMALLMPAIIDSKVEAGIAKAELSLAQAVADAKADAETGRQHARVALDKVEDFRAKLAEKGIKVNLDGH